MHKLFVFAAIAVLSVSLAACGTQPAMSQPADSASSVSLQTAENGLLSSFSTTDLDGNAVDESVLADKKLTMVNVWATYCNPCLQELPDLGTLSAKYADKDVQVIGIVVDTVDGTEPIASQLDLAKEIVGQSGADYLHLIPSKEMLETALRDVSAVPTTFFVDADGNALGDPYLGARSAEEWAQIIDGLLAEMV